MDKPITAVWEITMGCNMRCKHCGSSCAQPLPDELTTEEALALCDDIAELGLRWITLSGGEPLIRRDWAQLVRRLRERGVIPNVITNGWMCNEATIDAASEAGIGTFAISLDGPRDVHDYIRREGAFDRVVTALGLMIKKDVSAGAITTVHRRNLDRLDELYRILGDIGVTSWQLQIGLPMGNLGRTENADMVMPPEAVDQVLDFIHERSADPAMSIYPADCLGYYSRKEIEARTRAHHSQDPIAWQGCNAGKRSFGILHNGDILGCTSIRERAFIEGNIRERKLADIWNDPERFAWSRGLTKQQLEGHCRSCGYGDVCLGGCPNTRLTVAGSIHAANPYCAYHLALSRVETMLERAGQERLRAMAEDFVSTNEHQLAALALERLLSRTPDDVDALCRYGFVSYALHNYQIACDANEKALRLAPDNIYATKGLGVTLHSMGRTEDGIGHLRRAVEMADRAGTADAEALDSYHDLAVVYLQSGRKQEARALLDRAKGLSPDFAADNAALYQAAQ